MVSSTIPQAFDPVTSRFRDQAPGLDAFSRLRVSEPAGIFAAQNQYDADPLQFEGGATGSGVAPAHNANTRMVALSATNTGTSFIQSYEYIPYQPGRSQLICMTGLLGAGVAGAVVDVGLFDASNGIFLRQNGASGLQLVRRTKTSGGVVDNVVEQANWNYDNMLGGGVSGLTLNPEKVFILMIDAQFLGMGRVRVGFDIDGDIFWVHEFRNANVLTVPYIQTLTLPIQMLLTSTAASKTCHFKCASVASEGGYAEDYGYSFVTPEQTVTAASGARTHILSLRPATTFNGIENRIRITLSSINLIGGNQPVLWELCIGSTYSAGPTFAAVNATYSGAEYSSAVGTVSGAGLVIASGYVASSAAAKDPVSAKVSMRYPITLNRAGAQRAMGTLSLHVTGIGGTSACRASMSYIEQR